MNKTKIEWVRNPDGSQGYTWNPITGCLNHEDGLCNGGGFPCYAYRLAHGRLKARYLANKNLSYDYLEIQKSYNGWQGRKEPFVDPFYPRCWEGKLDQIRYIGRFEKKAKPKGIFVCDMSDLFGIGIPEEWTKTILNVCRSRQEFRFYLLTKQPQNLIKFSPFPDNCWVGVTACTNEMYYKAMRVLADREYWYNHPPNSVKAKIRYISFEPLLERVHFSGEAGVELEKSGIQWVIIGSQTKPYKPPKLEWVEEIVRACDKDKIPVFLKDNLEPLLKDAKFTTTHNLFWRDGYYTAPEHPNIDLHLRQEVPNVT